MARTPASAMAAHDDAPEGGALAAAFGAWGRLVAASWELHLLLVCGALFMLPEIPTDADVIKTALAAGVTLIAVLPSIAWRAPHLARAWFASTGGRLLVAAAVVAALSAWAAEDVVWSSAMSDRVLQLVLAHVAAILGCVAARRHPDALGSALMTVALIAAVVGVLQALGLENSLSPPPERSPSGEREIVSLMGNTNRAGALLALGVAALSAVLVLPRQGSRGPLLSALALALTTTTLVLTEGRGARLAATLGVLATVLPLLVWKPGGGAPRARPAWLWLAGALLAGVVGAVACGGTDVLLARKLPDSAPILSGEDVTTEVRLSLWRSTSAMVADAPFSGHGLGRFRAVFPDYREQAEASVVGLRGLPTAAWHPHNELLLGFAEGGLIGGGLLLLLLLLSLRRAWIVAREDRTAADLVALAVLVAGTAVGMLQDAWTSPGTALPFFAAVGYVWTPAAVGPPGAGRRTALVVALLALLCVGPMVRARLAGHWGAWRFQRIAAVEGINLENFELLTRAAAAAPRDEDLQRMLQHTGMRIMAQAPQVARQVSPHVADAVLRLETLGVADR